MSPAIRVALIGFTPFEREHIEAALQPTEDRRPVYVRARDLAACSLAVVNADDEMAVNEVTSKGRLASVVMLGTTPRPGAAAQLPRPISLAALLRTMDGLAQSPPPMSAAVERVQEDLARLLAHAHEAEAPPAPAAPSARSAAMPLIQGRHVDTAAVAPAPAAQLDHILVVDDDDLALRFMAAELERFGFELHRVRSGAQAIDLAARRRFEFVFLATDLDGLDGFHTCKTLKHRLNPHDLRPPSVVLLLGQDAAVDRLRAEMAGADACLVKPLNVQALMRVIGQRQRWRPTDEPTTRASSSMF
jgi:two-component system cell cycle response regulator